MKLGNWGNWGQKLGKLGSGLRFCDSFSKRRIFSIASTDPRSSGTMAKAKESQNRRPDPSLKTSFDPDATILKDATVKGLAKSAAAFR